MSLRYKAAGARGVIVAGCRSEVGADAMPQERVMSSPITPPDTFADPAGDPESSGEPPLAQLIVTPAPADLTPLVEYVWQLVLAGSPTAGSFWRVVADGYVDLAVRLPLDADSVRAAVAAPDAPGARLA